MGSGAGLRAIRRGGWLAAALREPPPAANCGRSLWQRQRPQAGWRRPVTDGRPGQHDLTAPPDPPNPPARGRTYIDFRADRPGSASDTAHQHFRPIMRSEEGRAGPVGGGVTGQRDGEDVWRARGLACAPRGSLGPSFNLCTGDGPRHKYTRVVGGFSPPRYRKRRKITRRARWH